MLRIDDRISILDIASRSASGAQWRSTSAHLQRDRTQQFPAGRGNFRPTGVDP